MSLNKNKLIFYFSLFCSFLAFGQETDQGTAKTEELEEVVITGQYNPQSVRQSVHNVTVINREQIERQAANNLADLLNFNLNLTVIPNSQTGRSTISFFGLDSEYFNILIDNIPLVSDNGLGNNIDLTQINLDDVERIEIVEGAMGVEYGANAVSGVINIITKKSIDSDWQVEAIVQEETVGDEYSWFDKGRHIQGLNIGHNFNEKWFAKAGFNRNQFAGFFNNRQGKDHYINDNLRGYDWLPKTQLATNATLYYQSELFNLNYKFEYFDETIDYYGRTVRPNYEQGTGISRPSATDRVYQTERFVNNINLYGRFNSGVNYNASLSYQQQERNLNEFNYYILTGNKSNETDDTYQSSKVFFSKGAVNNLVHSDRFNFQLGYEARFIEGFDSQASGEYSQEEKLRSQHNYALFASSEYNLSEAFSLRPGLRYEYNSKFNSQLTASLSARYLMPKGYELRANVGSSYRVPDFEELYYYFVDSNHDIRGNENLNPEKGFSAFVHFKKHSRINDISLLNIFKVSYIDIQDKIDMAVVNARPLQYQYININAYKLWGLTSENTLQTDRWNFKLGATLQGISRINEDEVNGNDDFLYSYQVNASSSYHLKKWDTYATVLFKYQGTQDRYMASGTDEEGNSLFEKQTIDGYGWLDASVKKTLFNRVLTATLGARNLLNITDIDISSPGSGDGVHPAGSQSQILGYGRSFYLKLVYHLNF